MVPRPNNSGCAHRMDRIAFPGNGNPSSTVRLQSGWHRLPANGVPQAQEALDSDVVRESTVMHVSLVASQLWLPATRATPRHSFPATTSNVAVGVIVGVSVTVVVRVGVKVSVAVAVGVSVAVLVGSGVAVSVGVGLGAKAATAASQAERKRLMPIRANSNDGLRIIG